MRRSCGRLWRLLRLLLVVACGGSMFEDIEATSTSCHYQEDGVIKTCELFSRVGCDEITSEPIMDYELSSVEEDEKEYNTTFKLWNSKGFFKVTITNISKCWKFQVGSAIYPKETIPVSLNLFPGSPPEINIFRDGNERMCDYHQHREYSLQEYRLGDGELKLSFSPVSGIREVNLTLISGECAVKCDGSECGCKVSVEEATMKDFKGPFIFTGLKHRYYCIIIKHGPCIIHTKTIKMEDPPPIPTPPAAKEWTYKVSILSVIAVLVAIVLVVIFVKKLCTCGTSQRQLLDTEEKDLPTQWKSIHQQWNKCPAPHKILLLYSRDTQQFCEVVQALRQLLQSFGNIQVLDPMEQNQMEQVSENISGWLTHNLNSPDVKLVVVVSEGAKIRQDALLRSQIVQVNDPHFLDSVFTHALRQMHENPKLGNDYKRIFPVRFEDFTPSEVSLSLIVPLKCYVLQKHLGKLVVELRNFYATNAPGLEDIQNICPQEVNRLESAIKNMKSYYADNPDYVISNFSV